MSAPSPHALRIPLLGICSRNARICVPKHMSTGTLKFVHVRMHGDTVVYSHTREPHSSKSQPLEMERASPSVSSQLLGVFSVSPQTGWAKRPLRWHPLQTCAESSTVRKNMELCEHHLPPQPVPASWATPVITISWSHYNRARVTQHQVIRTYVKVFKESQSRIYSARYDGIHLWS